MAIMNNGGTFQSKLQQNWPTTSLYVCSCWDKLSGRCIYNEEKKLDNYADLLRNL